MAEDPDFAAAQGQGHRRAAQVDAVLGRGVTTLDARWSPQLTRFDGDLRGLAVPSPVDHGTSATRLEGWAKCPHAYFQQYLLRVAQVELQAGPHRVVSLLTAEAVADLGLEPGMVATASVKATSVVVEVPTQP